MGATEPVPPAGYQKPHKPITATSWLDLLPGEVGLLVGTVGLFGGLTSILHDTSAVISVIWRGVLLDSWTSLGIYLAFVATVGSAIVLHEGVHVLTARAFGCSAYVERDGIGLRVRLHGGFLSRRADATISLAPSILLTVVGLPLLIVVESAFGAALVTTALIANVAGSGSDLASVLALRQLPPGSLLYYSEITQLAYEPSPVR